VLCRSAHGPAYQLLAGVRRGPGAAYELVQRRRAGGGRRAHAGAADQPERAVRHSATCRGRGRDPRVFCHSAGPGASADSAHRRALQDDEALADDMTVPQLIGYLDDCLEGDAKPAVAPGPPPALPPPPLQRLPSSDDDSTPAAFAEAYRVTGCRDPLGCGTFARTKASCDGSPGRRWQLSCDGPSSPTTCGRCAPVYLKDGAGEDGPVLFREVLTEGRSRWDIVQGVNGYNGRALDMCGGELLGSTNPVRVSRHTSQRSLHCIALVSFRAMMAVCLRCLAELWVAA
jgi:hypothetical protein